MSKVRSSVWAVVLKRVKIPCRSKATDDAKTLIGDVLNVSSSTVIAAAGSSICEGSIM